MLQKALELYKSKHPKRGSFIFINYWLILKDVLQWLKTREDNRELTSWQAITIPVVNHDIVHNHTSNSDFLDCIDLPQFARVLNSGELRLQDFETHFHFLLTLRIFTKCCLFTSLGLWMVSYTNAFLLSLQISYQMLDFLWRGPSNCICMCLKAIGMVYSLWMCINLNGCEQLASLTYYHQHFFSGKFQPLATKI